MGTAVIVILSAVAIIWMLRPFEGQKHRVRKPPVDQNPFYATSICSLESGCPEVKALASKRFLLDEVLPIPLPNCSADSCQCTYIHHGDRRTGLRDRREVKDLNESDSAWGRRVGRGRRKSDWRTSVVVG
ncbi:MAG: hypothetical protein V7754_15885 [Halioglobus sp.]